MNKSGMIGEILETGGSMAKRSGKTIAKAAGDTAKAAVSQITGGDSAVSDKDIVKNLYGIKDNKKTNSQQSTQQNSQQVQDQNSVKSIEDKQKLEEARKQLHNKVYYDPLVNPPKPKEEDRPAEKVEKEKMQDLEEDEQKKKDKPPPLVVKTQQRVEKFPGASG